MSAFNATIAQPADAMLSQTITTQATVSAADSASVGAFHVFFMIYKNVNGSWTFLAEAEPAGNSVNLTQAPKTFKWSYTPTSLGAYKIAISVRNASWTWQTVNCAPVQFTMNPIPLVNGFKYYVPISAPPPEVGIVPLIKQAADGSFLPSAGNWQMIPDMSIIDASALDTSKWRRRFWAFYGDKADHLNDELQRYVDSGVDYQNGQLLLTATPRAGTVGHADGPNDIKYPLFDSGMVRSVATSQFFFSHFQVVLPKAPGVWPAWWIIPGDGSIDPNPEMDMMEFVYNGANETANMIHCNCSANKALLWRDASYNAQFGYLKPSQTYYDADYWVNRPVDICILWSDDSTMTLYHDGNPTAKWFFPWYYRGGVAVPATIMINLAIGGNWPTNAWTLPVPSGPVTTTVNFLKTYTKIASKYGAPSPV
jgi:beta-glucanase (GH16 family)